MCTLLLRKVQSFSLRPRNQFQQCHPSWHPLFSSPVQSNLRHFAKSRSDHVPSTQLEDSTYARTSPAKHEGVAGVIYLQKLKLTHQLSGANLCASTTNRSFQNGSQPLQAALQTSLKMILGRSKFHVKLLRKFLLLHGLHLHGAANGLFPLLILLASINFTLLPPCFGPSRGSLTNLKTHPSTPANSTHTYSTCTKTTRVLCYSVFYEVCCCWDLQPLHSAEVLLCWVSPGLRLVSPPSALLSAMPAISPMGA